MIYRYDYGIFEQQTDIDFHLLAALRDAVAVPLVAHGTCGISLDDLTALAKGGMAKINFGEPFRYNFIRYFTRLTDELAHSWHPWKIMREVRNLLKQDMKQIIVDVKEACDPTTVLTTVYHMSAYDLYPPYHVGSVAATEVFNLVIRQLAAEHQCILADIWAAERKADWVIHPDTVHANDLGHLLIANRVFEAIATHCSGVSAQVTAELAEARAEVARTIEERRGPQHYDRT